jgi:hypothetical protein
MHRSYRHAVAALAIAACLTFANGWHQNDAHAAGGLTPSDPCRLLTTAEVGAVFAGAKAGVPERTREKYGITACEWHTSNGLFVLQLWTGEQDSTEDEIRGLVTGIVDPLKPAAKQSVRYERADVGAPAMIVVERQNVQTGILNDAALLVTQKGEQVVVLHASDLARRDRAVAIRALSSLGQRVVSRL